MSDKLRKLDKTTLGRERREALKGRIFAIKNIYRLGDMGIPQQPARIARMRAEVQAWDDEQEELIQRLRDAARLAGAKAYNALLETDDYDTGLQIVRELEAKARKHGWLKDDA